MTPEWPDAGTYVLPTRVDAGWVERELVDPQVHRAGAIVLNLDRVTSFDTLGESRLLSVLSQIRRARGEIHLTCGAELDVENGSPDRLVKLLRDTLGGIVLAQLATTAVDGRGVDRIIEIRRAQAETAARHDGIFRHGREWAAPIIDTFGAPPPSRLLTGSDEAYQSLFIERVALLNLGLLTDISLSSLVEFSYEAFDNTRQHGSSTLERQPIEGVRFVLQRVINANRERLADLARRVDREPFGSYLNELAADIGTASELRLVELTITDSGIGIPARMSGTEDIYTGPYEIERDAVKRAFAVGSTTRTSARGRGRGLVKVLRAAEALEAMLSVRVGRTELHRKFTNGDTGWHETQSELIGGTSVSMLFLWRADRQMTLDLAS